MPPFAPIAATRLLYTIPFCFSRGFCNFPKSFLEIYEKDFSNVQNYEILCAMSAQGGDRVNQWLADLFLSMPPWLRDPLIFGSMALALCWFGYFVCMRAPLLEAVRARCGDAFLTEQRKRPWRCVLYGSARKKAKLDKGGLYAGNLAAVCFLLSMSIVHVVLFVAVRQGMEACGIVDRLLVTVVAVVIGAACLWTQPGATVERRLRWGFGRANAVIHAAIWEALIVIALFLWLYDAWFLPAFAI